MKRRILAGFMALMLCLTLLPTAVFAAEQDTPSAVYVSSSGGDDTAGDGTKDKPYATLSKAVDAAEDGATIYVMSNLGMKDCARIDSKNLTITSLDGENSPYTITRSEKFSMISDNARSWYNSAMIEVQTATGSAGLTLTNIILDDDNSHEGTVFAQAISGDGKTDNTVYVQDAIIASNATVPCTITLGEGAVLRNFGGMSALRATDQAKIVMESGSVIEDTLDNLTRNKGTDTKSVGPAGAIWIQGGTFVMEKGSKIQNVNGRAVYADDGVVEIGGTISGITANSDMWQGANGTVVHLRNDAEGTLTGEISNCTDGVLVFVDKASFEMTTGSFLGNSAAAGIKTNEDPPKNADTSGYDTNRNTIKIDGEIAGITGNKNPIQFKYGKLTIASNAYIHNNKVNYGTLYIQKEAIVDIYGKINGNDAEKKGGGIATPGHGSVTINLYDGAEIKNNTAGESGGGIMISSNTTFNMYGGEISGNISKETGGGIYQNKPSSEIRLLGGTIKDNIMNATDISDSTTGEKNDLAISSNGYGNKAHFFYVSDDIALGNKAVYFQTDAKTVTPAADSLDIKLGNTSSENVTALTNASTATGWGNPLATFWAQRDGAAKLTVGGLTGLDSNLPVYVLALPVSDTGAVSDVPAQVYAAQKTSEADAVSFTLPDISDNGYAIAVVQPTADYGELTINGTPSIEEIKNTENYTVTYTATYTMPDGILSSFNAAGDEAGYTLTICPDSRLIKVNGAPKFENGTITATYTYTLPANEFDAGKSLFSSAVLTITVDGTNYTIPSNVAETKMVGLNSYTVVFDWNDGSDKTVTVSVVEGESLGTKMPADPTRSGYTFTGWNTQPDGTGTAVTKNDVVTGRLTAYAQWSKNSSGGGGSSTTYYFALEKIDAQDSHTLNGAKFGLYLDGKQIATATSNRSGIATFRVDESSYRKITTTSSLYYQELTAPEGYVVSSGKIDIEKSDLTTSQTTAEKKAETVRNYRSTTPADLNSLDHVAYVHGYTDGTVKPNNNITRAETAMMLYRLLTDTRRAEIQTVSNRFSDVSSSDWYNEAVSTMTNGNYIAGYRDGTFGGDRSITRAEFVTMLVRFIGTQDVDCSFTDISKDYWAYNYIATATQAGWIAGYSDGTFKPEQAITRAEAMTIINRTLNRGVDENSTLLNFKAWPDNTVSDWFYYEVIEATNEHEYTGARPSEQWTSLTIH